MIKLKRTVLDDDAIVINKKLKKLKRDEVNDSESDFTNRENRARNFKILNAIASARETLFVKLQSKKIFKQKLFIKIIMFMTD